MVQARECTHLVVQDNPRNTLRIPEQLVHVVVPDDTVVIPLSPHELSVNDLVSLVTNEAIERLDDRSQIEAFLDGVHPVLTLRRAVVIVCALEDEAQALGDEPHLRGLAPAEQPECDLAHTVVLAHVVHRLPPSLHRALKRLLRCALGASTLLHRLEALQARILRLPDRVVKVQLRGEVPFAVVRVLPTNVVRVQREQSLVRRHP